MAFTYHWRLQVRTYETDRHGRVQDSFYLNYLQEAATLASTAAGYSMDWYMEHRRLWLIRTMTIRYGIPAQLGDELEIATWVSDLKRVQSHRDYDVRRNSDGAQILRARANWVFVDQDTMQPTRVPEAFMTNFDPHTEPPENLELSLPNLETIENAHAFVDEQVAQPFHIDRANHVNNGVYPRWIEGAMAKILRSLPASPEEPHPQPPLQEWRGGMGVRFQPVWRRLEYLRAAQEGDRIRVVSQITGFNDQHIVWTHQVCHADSGEILVKDEMICRAQTPMSPDLALSLITGVRFPHQDQP